jgi:myosin heavy subunit
VLKIKIKQFFTSNTFCYEKGRITFVPKITNMENLQENRKGISPHWIYGPIIAILLAAGIYLFVTKNKSETKLEETTMENRELSDDKSLIESEYNAALARLDEMKNQSVQMDSLLNTKNEEVEELKAKIQKVLNDKNATSSQLKEANAMIRELNAKMSSYEKQIIALKQENVQLTEEKRALTEENAQKTEENTALQTDNQELVKKVEKGSVLHASSIRMEAIDRKKNLLGKEKEKETEKARKVDMIRISFNVDDNRISESGEKILYICVYEPSGAVASAGGKFKLENGNEKPYSTAKTIAYKQGEKVQGISTEWLPSGAMSKGEYKVEIYHMGYLIGSEKVTLK